MKYAESILFIGQCLTLSSYPEKVEQVKQEIITKNIDWEQIVFYGSKQFVLPALYLQLKRTSLLKYIPEELKQHLEQITNLNRNRNLDILKQVKSISCILNAHDISPIFLKGTAHLLCNLYDDPAERMIGDIDLLLRESDIEKAAQLLIDTGYDPIIKYNRVIHKNLKHYPRLVNGNQPAAVEIHRKVIRPPHDKNFSFNSINQPKQKIDGSWDVYIPAEKHLIIHNMLNAQINDKAYLRSTVLLRQLYDLILLSRKTNPQIALKEFGKYKKIANAYLASASWIFDNPKSISYKNNLHLRFFKVRFWFFLNNPGLFYTLYKFVIYFTWRIGRYLSLILRSFFCKEARSEFLTRVCDSSWYSKHFASYRTFFNS